MAYFGPLMPRKTIMSAKKIKKKKPNPKSIGSKASKSNKLAIIFTIKLEPSSSKTGKNF